MKLVFLHALPFDGRMWHSTARSIGIPSIAPNLWTLGETIEDWAAAVVDQVGTEKFIVVGCSVGGSCALEVARAAPDQVAGIVLVGAKAGVNRDPELRDQAVHMLETRGIDAAWQQYWAPLFAETTPRSVIEEARDWASEQGVAGLATGVRAFHNRRDLTDFAASWPKPLIGISGDRDSAPPPAKLRELCGAAANRSFHLVPDCGHYVNLEQPRLFEQILADLIALVVEG